MLPLRLHRCLFTAIIRGFGPAAQRGFGIGSRVMQALFLPVVALKLCSVACGGSELWRPSRRRVRQSVYSAIA